MGEELTGWELDYATLLLAADTLWGGDIAQASGIGHMIADAWLSSRPLPPIYHDDHAVALRRHGGVGRETPKDLITSFYDAYDPHTLGERVLDGIESFDRDRFDFIANAVRSFQTMCDLAHPLQDRVYANTRNAATLQRETGRVPTLSEAREELRMRLAQTGFEVTQSRNLRETYIAWEHAQGRIPPDQIQDRAYREIADLLQLTRDRVFNKLDFGIPGYKPDLSDVLFDGIEFKLVRNVFFTMSMAYHGKERDGKPTLAAFYEYNQDVPQTWASLHHLAGHEAIPGHYLHRAVVDLLYRAGKLGFESTLPTMCTPDCVFQEGWANVGVDLLYGGREAAIEALGRNYGVYIAHNDLECIAKHDVSYLYQVEDRSLDEVRRFVAEDCALPDEIVEKMAKAWTTHPLFGPMYGPAYYVGTRTFRKAIAEKGPLAVARIGLQLEGPVDIQTFERKVYASSSDRGDAACNAATK